MIELLTTKTETGCTPRQLLAALTGREWNDIHRDAAEFAARFWHTHFRPLHFKNSATRRYGYQFRQGENLQGAKGFRRSYTGQKLQQKGHTRPLVWSGDSERFTQILNIRATAKGGQYGTARATVIMNAPTLNLRSSPSSPNMRQELTTVIPEELDEISRQTHEFLAQRYRMLTVMDITRFRESGPI